MSEAIFPPTTRTALKEWAVACKALGRGDQIVLLRKGGISEEHREFRIEHPEFLLFPTYEHQRADLVKPLARAELERLVAEPRAAESIELRHWATVAEVLDLTVSDQVAAVDALHLWSESYALERLRWRPRKPLQLMLLRVYRLPRPATLTLLAEYGGCKSWLSLAEPITVEGARPVLDDAAFAEQVERAHRALGRQPSEVAS